MSNRLLPKPARQGLSRRQWLQWTAVLAASGLPASSRADPQPATIRALRDLVPRFSTWPIDAGLPEGWAPHRMRPDKRDTVYRTLREPGDDRTVIHARSQGGATGLRCDLRLAPSDYRWLAFSWRTDRVPTEARSDDDTLDDCPARIVVAFDGDMSRLTLRELIFQEQVELFTGQTLPYATLMYVWDGQLPREQVVRYSRSGRIRYLVAESGAERQGQWCHYRRDLVADFERVFGESPGAIRSIGVFTDSDDLGQPVDTLYGDVRLLPGESVHDLSPRSAQAHSPSAARWHV